VLGSLKPGASIFVKPAPGSLAQLFLRPIFEAAATIVAVWILWTVISAIIDEKMPRAIGPGEEDQVVPGSASRFRTLLPLLRHAVLIVIVVVGIVAVLERLGFNIGPLLAGLRCHRDRYRLWRAQLGARRHLRRFLPDEGRVSGRRVHPER
jgi:hypothetical protein